MDAKVKKIMDSLDNYRMGIPRIKPLTKEQIDFLKKCREHDRPVSFRNIVMLWEQCGWGQISETRLRARYLAIDKKQ